MIRLAIFYLNLGGLLVVQVLEAWRPGSVSAVVPLVWVWVICFLLIGLTILIPKDEQQSTRP